jgi:gliding motility-associated-like protein
MNQRLRSLLLAALSPLLVTSSISAQLLPVNQPEQQSCDALVLCGNSFTTPYSYQGIGTSNNLPNTPCSGGEANSMWLRLNVNTAGTIVFTITPIASTDDYDFAVINATGITDCNNLTSAMVVACNYNNNYPGSNVNGVIGLNSTSTTPFVVAGNFGNSFCQQINANAGDSYLIMVNNFGHYSGSGTLSSGFTIDFTGSTAVFNQPPPPFLEQVLPLCDLSQEITIKLNDNILCSSIAPDGSDFSLSPSGSIQSVTGVNCSGLSGYTNKIKIEFNGILPNGDYTIHARTGTDGNTLLGLCNSPLALPDSLNFHVGIDPIAYLSIDSPACQFLKINLNTPAACNSIAANGSDFIVTGPSAVYIASATGTGCMPGGFTSSVQLTLSQPIAVDGLYKVRAMVGGDGNTVIDSCGRILPTGLEIPFTVNSFNGILQAYPDTTICNPGSTIDLYGINNGPPPTAGFEYNWTPSTGVQNPHALTTPATLQGMLNYYVLETIDKNGCYLRDSAKIKIKPLIASLAPQQASVCLDDPLQLVASGGNQYSWYDNPSLSSPATTLNCTNCPNPQALPPVGNTTYYVIVTNEAGCKDTLKSDVTINPLPVIESYPADTTIKYGKSAFLYAYGGVGYTWTPTRTLNDSYSPNPVATPLKTTEYVVIGANEFGCLGTDTSVVHVDFRDSVLIPNAFSPNGDGTNDVFRVENMQYQKLLEFRVFNRWGEQVFETTNMSKGWDGTVNGKPANVDVYYYLIRLGFADDLVQTYKGDVTLIR